MKSLLAPHPGSVLEYWFFKVNAGTTALLVDWIARRKVSEGVLRVSVHSPGKREVLSERQREIGLAGESFLSLERTAGRVGEVEWELAVELGDERIDPQTFPAKQLRLFDMALASAPLATFTGWIRHGATRVELRRAPGMISHYWGRQLAPEWWWVSANQFDQAGIAVECMVLRSGVWGVPAGLPLAYLYLHREQGRQLWITPPDRAQVSGSPESLEIEFRRPGAKPVRLVGRGRDYGDLGDGIVNTLVGDLDVFVGDQLIARAEGTAGLERRFPHAESRAE